MVEYEAPEAPYIQQSCEQFQANWFVPLKILQHTVPHLLKYWGTIQNSKDNGESGAISLSVDIIIP